ncbi:MAG: acyl-CoA thioesterase [Anaerolineae bacterium]
MNKSFTTEIRVRWSDIDVAEVVYFGHYFRYFEMAEEDFYRSLGYSPLELEEELGVRLPRIEAHCRFLRPARMSDLLSVTMRVGEIGRKTITYNFEVRKREDEQLLAEGQIVAASVAMDGSRAVELPPKLVKLLEPYLEQKEETQNG